MEKQERCWASMGCWSSQPSCSRLAEVVHCRNCPVFVEQGRQLLEQEVPSAVRQKWSDSLSQPQRESHTLPLSALVFRLGSELFALPTGVFEAVLAVGPVHSLPHIHNRLIRGFAVFRGRLELCIRLEILLGLEPGEPGQKGARMLAVSGAARDESHLLFEAPTVLGTCRYAQSELGEAHPSHIYLQGLFSFRQQRVGLLRPEAIFTAAEKGLGRR